MNRLLLDEHRHFNQQLFHHLMNTLLVFLWFIHMADNTNTSKDRLAEEQAFAECKQHSEIGFKETDSRATGKKRIGAISFNEADELFRSWLDENNWPYDALLFDPRVFTVIFEKTSRLIANKPKGKLNPREGSDVMTARINNQLLDYQWDQANIGGTMISKYALMDMNTRKYGASFGLCTWRYELDNKGNVVFDGPEMKVLNNRDTAHDLTATSIENCNWFQVRQYVTWQDLKNVNDQRSKPIYKNLDKLKVSLDNLEAEAQKTGGGGDTRSVNWMSRNRAIAGLETDPIGKDYTFKTIELITEYRRDRWITFARKHGVVLRDIPNPYENYELPITMLRYYQIDDDLYGLSEIEPIKGLQKAINALLCQYVDEINQKLYTPIAYGPGVKQHTLEWGKGARWSMQNPMTDFRLVESRSNAAQYFNNTYSVLVAAMMNALGESSLGVSNVQPYQKDKTATEVKALQLQRNARDNFNQIFLAEAIKRQYMLWHSMNQKLLFSDPKKKSYILRIVGPDAINFYQQNGLDQTTFDTAQLLKTGNQSIDQVVQNGQTPSQDELDIMTNAESFKHPVNTGTEQKPSFVPKLKTMENGKSAELAIEPKDLEGTYDFSIDVESMTVNADDEKRNARQTAVTLLASNPNVTALLASEQVKPKFKELFVTWLEDLGFMDADKYFEKMAVPPVGAAGAGNPLAAIMGGAGGPSPTGIPGGTNPNQGGETPAQSPFGQPQPKINLRTLSPEALQNSIGGGQ